MEVIICQDRDVAARLAAREFERQIRRKPASVLGLATGSTPLGLYRELADRVEAGQLDLRACTTFNLDEYVGLPPSHPASYAAYMQEHFFSRIPVARWRIPNGIAADIENECASYEASIADAGGIDLQLLGLGSDGHIGFNEPSSSLASRTRLKTLTQRTIDDNARFFPSAAMVPHHVITMGVGTIMEARRVVVLAFGEGKSAAIAATVEGPITANVPGSILQMHPSCSLFVDEAAASRLERAAYYRWVWKNKPDWQVA